MMYNEDMGGERKVSIDKEILIYHGSLVGFKSVTEGLILGNVVEADSFRLVTRNVHTDIELTLCNWLRSLQRSNLVISPN